MTGEVVGARYGTPFKDVAKLIAEQRIRGLPVIDTDEKVIGVISETNLLVREAQAPVPDQRPSRFRLRRTSPSPQRRRGGVGRLRHHGRPGPRVS
ncbi:CBS domain-containing protein [Streptomyces longisporoflavus]|uniref:CBS domain-containing protein n=1 Tax=Streptomyces longisporoflavus TaxID=28044 RepID=UPI0027E5442F|nr:CBS domain-containing protein [Streptomyces longisporoflavus]